MKLNKIIYKNKIDSCKNISHLSNNTLYSIINDILYVWNYETNSLIKQIDEVNNILCLEDYFIFSKKNEGNLHILDYNFNIINKFFVHDGNINDIKRLDKNSFITCGKDSYLKQWNINNFELISELLIDGSDYPITLFISNHYIYVGFNIEIYRVYNKNFQYIGHRTCTENGIHKIFKIYEDIWVDNNRDLIKTGKIITNNTMSKFEYKIFDPRPEILVRIEEIHKLHKYPFDNNKFLFVSKSNIAYFYIMKYNSIFKWNLNNNISEFIGLGKIEPVLDGCEVNDNSICLVSINSIKIYDIINLK
jgi:WD40 repeat protein